MGSSRLRDVIAYRKAAEFADEVGRAVSQWGKRDLWTIGIQVIRSSGSVGANIAEALGRGSVADGRRLLYNARGSLLETEHWVDRARRRGLFLPPDSDERLSEIARLLHGLLRSDQLHP